VQNSATTERAKLCNTESSLIFQSIHIISE
jgi:hypothetical protein